MKQLWNEFCRDVQAKKSKDALEMDFEINVVRKFLSALRWLDYLQNLEEQKSVYKGKDRADFFLHTKNNKEDRQIVVELKRPEHKQKQKDIQQLERYLKSYGCRFGLYIGEKLEVFYRQPKGDDFEAVSVVEIDFIPNNPAAEDLLNLIQYDNYDKETFTKYCLDNIEVNNYVRLWQTKEGEEELYNAVIDAFKLPKAVSQKLQSVLKFQIINTRDAAQTGTQRASAPKDVITSPKPDTQGQGVGTKENTGNNTWLICYDNKNFDVESCFKKLGQVFWKHKSGLQNVKKGDIAYLYANRPVSAVRFKVEVIESQIPYSSAMAAEDEFSKKGYANPKDGKDRYFLVRPLAEKNIEALKHAAMYKAGLIGKRPSTTKLSKDEFKALRQYIEQHFNNASIKDNVPDKTKRRQDVSTKPKKSRMPEAPFRFSMIGLKAGDTVVFDSLNIEVSVASDNTIIYKGKEYRLTTFCKEFLPEERRTKSNTYRGPDYFSYQGKTLTRLRKEKHPAIKS